MDKSPLQPSDVPTSIHQATQPHLTPETFKKVLGKLISSPKSFTREDKILAFEHLLDPSSTLPSQIGSFLTALHLSGREGDVDILAGGAEVLRRYAIVVDVPEEETNSKPRMVVDIVGTGGDGHNTFNVSTTAAVIAAGAGARVYKHGNRASTSSSGAADLLITLGCPLSPHISSPRSVPDPKFRFLLAPHHHPLLAPLAPIRRTLPHRTILNLLGPLVNPSRPAAIVIGVAHASLGPTFIKALSCDEKVQRAWVVCGEEGLDEISCAGPTHVWEYMRGRSDGEFAEFSIEPSSFGLRAHSLDMVKGGKGPEENAETFMHLINPEKWGARKGPSEDVTPVLEFVLMNAAAVLLVADVANSLEEGVRLARESVVSGNAWDAFCSFRDWDNSS